MKELRKYFFKGTLEINPQNCKDLLGASERYADSFMSYGGMLFVKNWGNGDDLVTLADILQSFSKVTKLKVSFLGENVAELAEIIARGVQFYEELIELDISECQLEDSLLEDIMESVHLENLRCVNIANNNINQELITNLQKGFPEIEFVTEAPDSESRGLRFRNMSSRKVSSHTRISSSADVSNSPNLSPNHGMNLKNSFSEKRHGVSENKVDEVDEKEKEKEVLPFYTPSQELTAYARLGFKKSLPAIAKGSIEYGNELGQGGFGTVYQGIYQGKIVAVKKLLRLSEEQIASFQKEAMIMSNYRHKNLISFLGYCPEEYAFMMEYASGGSLWSLLKSSQAISWEKLYEIGLDVAKGMEYLHDNGVVHCDLKSDNILLDSNRCAKLTDFGISALRREHVSSGKSTYGEWGGGTYRWMAPEIFHTQRNTKAGDVYAYGLVLWQLGSRKEPFSSIGGLLPYIAAGNKEVITADTPPLIKQVIELCWLPEEPLKKATDTQDRPSMQEVRWLLEKGTEEEKGLVQEKEKELLKSELEQLKKEKEELMKQLEQADSTSERAKGSNLEEKELPQERANPPAKVNKEKAEINVTELEVIIAKWPKGSEILGELIGTKEKEGGILDFTNYYKLLNTDQFRILFQHPRFKQATLKFNSIGSKGISKLLETLLAALPNTQIHALDLGYNNIGDAEAKELAKDLPDTQIHILNLKNNQLEDAGAKELAKALPNTEIHTLNLSTNNIGAEGAIKLFEILPNTQIHNLDLGLNNIGAEGAIKLFEVLPNTQIHTLNLWHNNIGAGGAIKLIQALPNTQIHTLNLCSNDIGAGGATKLAEALPNTQIHTLDLSDNKMGAQGAIKLVEVLPTTQIHTLNLRSNYMGTGGAIKLAQALPTTQIHNLDLSFNGIDAEGAIKLSQVLSHTQIHTLRLGGNRICVEGVSKLAQVLPTTQIHTLDLGCGNDLHTNNIGVEGATKLIEALPNTQIHTLDLTANHIGDEGASKLAQALPTTKIHTLRLWYNHIGDEGAGKLAQVLLNTKIHVLDLSLNNNIGTKTKYLLRSNFPYINFGSTFYF